MDFLRVRSVFLAIALLGLAVPSAHAQLSPTAFTSLGTLNATSGTLTINTDTLAMTGAATFTGVATAQTDGPQIAVFDFASINISSSVTVVITGSRPIAFLSRGNATISATLPNIVGGGDTGGFLEIPSSTLLLLSQTGQGPGAGGAAGVNSGGGGYGGIGGGTVGGNAYGNLFQSLVGGSGGGAALESNNTTGATAIQGGDGGGAIGIVAAGNLTVASATANGGGIFSNILSGDDYSAGGGAGGGILLSGGTGLTVTGTLAAKGSAGISGGAGFSSGGGGGQIALSGLASYTLGSTTVPGITTTSPSSLSGGNGNGSTVGTFGAAGVLTVDALSTVIPSGTSVTLNGTLITSVAGSNTQNAATINAYIRHSAIINSGGSVTLGIDNALQQLDISGNNITAVTNNGTLNLNGYSQTVDTLLGTSTTASLSIPSDSTLTVGIDNSVAGSGASSYSGQISGAGALVKVGTGSLTLSGVDTFSGTTTVSSGAFILANNQALQNSTVTLSGSSLSFSSATALVLGALAGSTNQSLTGLSSLTVGGNNSSTTYSGNLSGSVSGGLNKTGTGTWTLTGTNTQSGPLDVQAGTLQAGSAGAISTSGSIAVFTGATLDLNGYNDALISGNSITVQGTLRLGGASLSVPAGAAATYNGGYITNGALVGSGTQTLTGGATLSGITTSSSVTISQTGAASVSNFTNNGQFNNAAGQSLSWSNGTVTSAGKLTVSGVVTASDFVSNGTITINGGGALNNSGSNIVLGGGSQTTINASGALSTAAGTTIELNDGLLINNGTITGTTDVNYGSLAKGSGTYGVVNVSQGGEYAPGNSPGIVTATAVNFASSTDNYSAAQLQIQLAGTTPGTQYDQLHVTGQLSLGGILQVQLLNSFSPKQGNAFDIMDWGTLVGQFNTLELPALSAGLAWSTTQLYTTGTLAVVSSNFIPGDFSRDGHVDAADILAMEQALIDPSDFEAAHGNLTAAQLLQLGDMNGDGKFNNADLQSLLNFLRSGGGSIIIVPEPASLTLLALAAAAGLIAVWWRRPTRQPSRRPAAAR